ncbi:hypothetical protein [Meiothermus sp.]|uniref:hypothetical protein n=1 Tax=Meiothermus sp. TaxID=1955249 RepID=UPI00262A6068|nr:hypothetical protein [Meiothermus sp.]
MTKEFLPQPDVWHRLLLMSAFGIGQKPYHTPAGKRAKVVNIEDLRLKSFVFGFFVVLKGVLPASLRLSHQRFPVTPNSTFQFGLLGCKPVLKVC